MKWSNLAVSFLLATLLLNNNLIRVTEALEPITLTLIVVAVGGGGYGAYYWSTSDDETTEKCHDRASGNRWINYEPNFAELRQRVFGQHIAVDVTINNVAEHLKNDNPRKALVLSYHGYTGVGKTFLSEQLASEIYSQYRENGESGFVHHHYGTHNMAADLESNRLRLIQFIENGLVSCERSLFIIDEVDKFPSKFLDNLIPYMQSKVTIAGKKYNARKAIYILLSNTGGDAINGLMKKLRDRGVDREKTRYWHFEKLIDQGILQKEGGLNDTELVNRAFIDRTVPFLPLERDHIKQCVVDYLRDHRGFPNPQKVPGAKFIEELALQTEYVPAESELYSRFGCARVKSIVNTVLPLE